MISSWLLMTILLCVFFLFILELFNRGPLSLSSFVAWFYLTLVKQWTFFPWRLFLFFLFDCFFFLFLFFFDDPTMLNFILSRHACHFPTSVQKWDWLLPRASDVVLFIRPGWHLGVVNYCIFRTSAIYMFKSSAGRIFDVFSPKMTRFAHLKYLR